MTADDAVTCRPSAGYPTGPKPDPNTFKLIGRFDVQEVVAAIKEESNTSVKSRPSEGLGGGGQKLKLKTKALRGQGQSCDQFCSTSAAVIAGANLALPPRQTTSACEIQM